MNCIIVDDEPIARDLLKTYVSQVPYLHLVATCGDAFEAMEALKGGEVDLVILDINMPRLTGFDMLRTLKKYPAVIITSAYQEYALEGFELSVTDYLLKPFSFARFVQATGKVADAQAAARSAVAPGAAALTAPAVPAAPAKAPAGDHPGYLVVKADKKLTKVLLEDIRFVEAYGNYIYIHLVNGKLLSKQTLTQFEEQLPPERFTRIHKSFIVSLKAIKYLEGNEVSMGDRMLPVGKVYGENLRHRFR